MEVLAWFALVMLIVGALEWMSLRRDELEKKIDRLEIRLLEVENLVAEPGRPKPLDGPEKHKRFALFYLLVVIAAALATFWVYWENSENSVVSEYLSYVLPCIAAVIGAFGLYYPETKRVEWWFWSSGFLLGGGLIAFVLSKPYSDIVAMATIGLIATTMSLTFLRIGMRRRQNFWPKSCPQWCSFVFGFVLLLASFATVALSYVYAEIIKHPNDWQSRGLLQEAVLQAVKWLDKLRQR